MELPHIGENCIVCNRNDYLPFKCAHCDKTVCIDHKTNHGNECPINSTHFEADQANGQYYESLKRSCDYCKKITLKLELTECLHCRGLHCLYHRHQVQHKCKQLDVDRANLSKEIEQRSERQKAAIDRIKEISKPVASNLANQQVPVIRSVDPKKRELAKRVRIMRLKQSARGPPNILPEDKIHFEIKFVHEPTATISKAAKDGSRVKIFTTPKHTIGRMIDWCSTELDLTNRNQLAEASQLVFKKLTDSGELIVLDSQACFSQCINEGCLEDGDDIIITYR